MHFSSSSIFFVLYLFISTLAPSLTAAPNGNAADSTAGGGGSKRAMPKVSKTAAVKAVATGAMNIASAVETSKLGVDPNDPDAVCWLGSYGRGVGKIPDCAPSQDKDAGLCYSKCPNNYKGVGPVCWPNEISKPRGVGTVPRSCGRDKEMDAGLCYNRCPGGYKQVGPLCWKGLSAVGRGVGTIPRDCDGDKEFQDGLCYSKCPPNFKGRGPVCWNNDQSKPRGVGTIPKNCPNEGTLDLGLCYTKCKEGYKGVGPVCWGETCPSFLPHRCGLICVKDESKCKSVVSGLVSNGVMSATSALSDPMSAFSGSLDIISKTVSWPKCDKGVRAASSSPSEPVVEEPVAPIEPVSSTTGEGGGSNRGGINEERVLKLENSMENLLQAINNLSVKMNNK